MSSPYPTPDSTESDEFLWLEQIHGERALDWVREQNARTEQLLDGPELDALESAMLKALDAPDRIAMVSKRGPLYYNFWRDAEHPRGLWRRTDWESYRAGTPQWEVLLDVDRLAQDEQTPWVFAGAQLLRPDRDRALLRLSPDGGDAVRVREFDLTAREFVPVDQGGFDLPVAKTHVSWLDRDRLLVGTVVDPDPQTGDVTRSSYPRSQRVLRRGEELTAADQVFTVDREHVAAFGHHDSTPGWERTVAVDAVDFHRSVTWLRTDDPSAGTGEERPGWRRIEVPEDAEVSFHRQWITVYLKTDAQIRGTDHRAGSLLVAPAQQWLDGAAELNPVFLPDARTVLSSWTWTASHLVLVLLQDVASVMQAVPQDRLTEADAAASARPVPLDPPNPHDPFLTLSAAAVDDEDPDCGDDLWVTATGALTPTTLLRLTLDAAADLPAGPQTAAGSGAVEADVVLRREVVASAPERFDASALAVTQHWVTSDDGTQVPYFQIGPQDAPLDGRSPVVMDGYGGFQASKLPGYSAIQGLGWLSRRSEDGRTGIWVIANIRGGGEFGPGWHRAALRENRHRAYQDFAAVARDLVARGVTSRERLAATGRSNGGLLMGNMATQYPELFGALSCGVPLLDMRRYTVLSAGHSWIAEYGDPDVPEDWAFIRTYSPYHLLVDRPVAGAQAGRDAEGPGTGYPHQLVWTATSDDRVGPVQARKYAARLQRLGVPQTWFHEDLDGGHAGASDNRQAASMNARSLHFLWRSVAGSGHTL
ncbi:prolyl oligopeptidase family serine peptidase [Micrococcus terreus]|uniref:prolyl oligopeptidase family serine peptidase n=1 Tax=Micrococcus terreus TaxID=574650 RepID=UPI00254F44D1|nr:prolyl oligopeptidase family serine peptidase [Micrococcus terreus]MDK7701902.1 prolyl oligopeptidase family serine peptidase [Micrococcus terreus]WOO97460.1 prolyl oligopeptidase family serine peptidase [Micrococcus terreus]